MIDSSQILGKPVLSVTSGQNCGTANCLCLDGVTRLLGVTCFDTALNSYDFFALDSIAKIGDDAIVMRGESSQAPKCFDAINCQVFDTKGRRVGMVSKVEFFKNFGVKHFFADEARFSPKSVVSFSCGNIIVKPIKKPKSPTPFMVGRRTTRDIFDKGGVLLFAKGTLVNNQTVQKAKLAQKLLELSYYSVE